MVLKVRGESMNYQSIRERTQAATSMMCVKSDVYDNLIELYP